MAGMILVAPRDGRKLPQSVDLHVIEIHRPRPGIACVEDNYSDVGGLNAVLELAASRDPRAYCHLRAPHEVALKSAVPSKKTFTDIVRPFRSVVPPEEQMGTAIPAWLVVCISILMPTCNARVLPVHEGLEQTVVLVVVGLWAPFPAPPL